MFLHDFPDENDSEKFPDDDDSQDFSGDYDSEYFSDEYDSEDSSDESDSGDSSDDLDSGDSSDDSDSDDSDDSWHHVDGFGDGQEEVRTAWKVVRSLRLGFIKRLDARYCRKSFSHAVRSNPIESSTRVRVTWSEEPPRLHSCGIPKVQYISTSQS